ncbi:hypothetical protein [Kitasatospora sp. KL5]
MIAALVAVPAAPALASAVTGPVTTAQVAVAPVAVTRDIPLCC